MDEAKAFGLRVREVRSWRQLTLREAAGLAGRSFSFWGQVERGERAVTNCRTLEAMANALRVHPSELTGQPWTQRDARHADAQTGLESIEIALERYALGADPEVSVRSWPEIAEDLERLVTTMRWTADYAAQSELAPVLIGELHGAYVRLPHQRPEVLVGLMRAYASAVAGCRAWRPVRCSSARRPWGIRHGWAMRLACAGVPPVISIGSRSTAARSLRRRA